MRFFLTFLTYHALKRTHNQQLLSDWPHERMLLPLLFSIVIEEFIVNLGRNKLDIDLH